MEHEPEMKDFATMVQKFICGKYQIDISKLDFADQRKFKEIIFMLNTLLKFYNSQLVDLNDLKRGNIKKWAG